MNKQCYQIIFNKKRGQMMVVAENTVREGKSTADGETGFNGATTTSSRRGFKLLSFSLMLALGSAVILSPIADARVVADPNAPGNQRPTILPSANGTPQVNIQKPTKGGVSMNQYQQFDVDKKGVILNNSRKNTQTQLGGMVQANPWLAGGSAKVIVNQVNSRNPSQLNGYVEVAGQKADVIIANQAGLSINGGGFINAPRVTLTTGNPIIKDGLVAGYAVQGGAVNIHGEGLDVRDANYTRILTAAANINGGVWGQNVDVVAGHYDLDANDQISTTAADQSAPAFAIDTGALGGMYAGKITLVSTDRGRGIQHQGQLFASAGGVSLSADGQLSNSGVINSNGKTDDVNILATSVHNSGTVSSQHNQSIQTQDLTNTGLLASAQELNVQATDIVNDKGTFSAGRLDLSANTLSNLNGELIQTGQQSLLIEAGQLSNTDQGHIGAVPLKDTGGETPGSGEGPSTGPEQPSGPNIDQPTTPPSTGSAGGGVETAPTVPVTLATGQINIAQTLVNQGGVISGSGGVDLVAQEGLSNQATLHLNKLSVSGDQLDNRGGELSANDIKVNTDAVHNQQGRMTAFAHFDTNTGQFNNQKGVVLVGKQAQINADVLDNSQKGQIASNETLSVMAQTLNNQDGELLSGSSLNLSGQQLDNRSGTIESQQLDLAFARIDNQQQGAIRANEALNIKATQALANQQGQISSANSVTIHDGGAQTLSLSNTQGEILAGTDAHIQAKFLSGDGMVAAGQDLSIGLKDDFVAQTDIEANRNLSISTEGRLINQASIQSGAEIQIDAKNVDNQASGIIQAENHTQLNVAENLSNRGLINSNGLTLLQVGQKLDNVGTGKVYGDHVAIAAHTVHNREEAVAGVTTAATIAARERLDIGAQHIINQEHALLFSGDSMHLGGSLDANHQATGSANLIENKSATIESLGDMAIAAVKLVNSNEHFSTETVLVKGPTNVFLISPEGDANKYDGSNFQWQNWSRAGRYVWKNSPSVGTGTILGKTPILRLGEESCSNPLDESTCVPIPGSEYAADNPAWAYFNLTAPAGEPAEPNLVAPIAPTMLKPIAPEVPAGESCDGSSSAACVAYAQALSKYEADLAVYTEVNQAYAQQKAAYDLAINAYHDALETWYDQNEAQFDALDEAIERYNGQFNQQFTRWTQYEIVRREYEDQVKTSDPGRIVSGGNMTLSGSVINDKSTIIAGKTMIGGLDNIQNIDATGEYIITDEGTSQYTRSRWRGGFKRYHQRKWDGKQKYADEQRQTITLSVANKQENASYVSDSHNQRPTDVGSVNSINGVGAQNGAPNVINSTQPNTRLPNSSLYSINPNGQDYLVETDPRFTNGKQWLGSDYMLKMMGANPDNMHKRLGDGYYEQRLVNEQVAQLTGNRYLGGYENDEAQFKALMNSGATFAQAHNLAPGVSLSKEMVAQLTSDMVWLETQTVTLADGRTQSVLVPKLYVVARSGDLSHGGTLIAANDMQLNVSGDLDNSGTIAGRNITALNAQNINNIGGRIQGAQVQLQAKEDINVVGGSVIGQKSLALDAGRDLNVITTTSSTEQQGGGFNGSRTSIDRVAGLYVTEDAGILLAQSGRDINLAAANVSNSGAEGQTYLLAGNDLNVGTVTTGRQESTVQDAKNYRIQNNSQEVGSNLNSQGDMTLQAQGQVTVTASDLNSEAGALSILGVKGVTIQSGLATDEFAEGRYHKDSGALSSKSREVRYTDDNTQAVSSNVTGASVQIHSDQDVNIKGSNVVADQKLTLSAGQNISIEAAEETNRNSQFHESKKSGLMSSGGVGFTIGKNQLSTDSQNTNLTHQGSMVGSLGGDVTMVAGEAYRQIGSTVSAQQGDVTIMAKQVDIVAAEDRYSSDFVQKQKQSGLTVALSAPAISAAMQAKDTIDSSKKVGQSKNTRVNAMAAANTAMDGYKSVGAAKDAISNGMSANNVSVSITYGSSKSEQSTKVAGTEAAGSTIYAGGNVNIVAAGADKASNINIVGSEVAGGMSTNLLADNEVNILAAEQTHTERSDNKSSGWNAGVAISYGSNGPAFGVTAGGNKGKGYGDGDEVSYVNSHVGSSTGQTSIVSGGATNIIGGQVIGKGVAIDAAELNIESLQDTATFKGKQQDISGQVTVGYGASASGSFSKSKINADYASVNEQSGILAGDDGYQINVKGNTDLKGGLITSTQLAQDQARNQLTTGTLTSSDIQNHADYEGSSFGISGGGSIGGGKGPKEVGGMNLAQVGQNTSTTDLKTGETSASGALSGSKSIGFGADSGHDKSTTYSGINTQNINIVDVNGQQLTGKNAEAIIAQIQTSVTTDTAAQNSGHIGNNFDKDKVQKELDLQREVSQAFDQNRQEVKDRLYSAIKDKRDEATALRMANNGFPTDESKRLDAEADALAKNTMYFDLAVGGVWGGLDVSNLVSMGLLTQSDLVYQAATADKKYFLQTCKGPNVDCQYREVLLTDIHPDERTNLITVSNPGILNDLDASLKNASKQNATEINQGGIIVIPNPETGNPVAELMYAAYDKVNNLTGAKFLPLTNSQQANLDLLQWAQINQYVIDTSNHSRGGLTASISSQAFINKGYGVLPINQARFYGTATNVQDYANLLAKNGSGQAYSAVHETDFVGRSPLIALRSKYVTGGNPPTGGIYQPWFYSHSSYFYEMPPEKIIINGKIQENPLYKEYISAWGNDPDASKPKLVKPTVTKGM
ncbi:hemagglutinin repeat-containing protein [Neisseriaceae bacterium CLB008]